MSKSVEKEEKVRKKILSLGFPTLEGNVSRASGHNDHSLQSREYVSLDLRVEGEKD